MNQQKIGAFAVSILLIFSLSFSVFADSIGDLESSKNKVKNKINDTQGELKGVKDKKNATQEDLEKINQKIDVLQEDINKLQGDLDVAEKNLTAQQEEYEKIKEELEKSQSEMQARIHSIYVNGDISYWEVIFKSSSIQEFLSSLVFCEKITEQDKNNIISVQENKRLAAEKVNELKKTQQQIADIKSNKEKQEGQFAAESQTKAGIVASLEEDEAFLEKQLAEMAAESAKIEAEIQDYYAKQATVAGEGAGSYSGGQEGTGSMRWPVAISGTISSDFGTRSRGMHTGIDIACSYGTPVVAADSGTVILVKRLNYSYGYHIAIDHGGSISTLYAHMSSISVSLGQNVSKGQTVGAVGSTGNSTGPHLHFEVRINGKYVNPWGYVSKP